MRSLHFGVCLATAALLIGTTFGQAQSRPPLLGFVDESTLERNGMMRKWYVQIPRQRIRERVLSLKQQEDLLFAASDRGLLHCIDSESGRILWSQTVSEAAGEVFPPALTKDSVFVTSGTRMTQLDRKTGSIILTAELSSMATSGPGANEEYCFVQTVDNRISALRLFPDADEELKQWPFKRKFTLPYVQWFFDAGSRLSNPPIVLNDRVIFTSENGIVFANVLNERNLYYRYIPGAPIAAPVSFRDKVLYVATVDYNLFAVNVMSGRTVWRFASGYPIHRQPLPFPEDVYLTPDGGGLFSLDNADGMLRWVNESVNRVIAASQTRVYAMSPTLRFTILDRSSGAILGGWPSMDFPISAYNQATDRIFLATERGLIICLAEKGNVEPYVHGASQEPTQEQPQDAAPPDSTEADPDSEEMQPDEADPAENEDEPADPDEEMEAPEDEPADPDEEMEAPEDDSDESAPE